MCDVPPYSAGHNNESARRLSDWPTESTAAIGHQMSADEAEFRPIEAIQLDGSASIAALMNNVMDGLACVNAALTTQLLTTSGTQATLAYQYFHNTQRRHKTIS